MTGAVDWIIAACAAPLMAHEVGTLDTSSGQLAMIDPLVFWVSFEESAFKVPKTGGRIVVLEDTRARLNSKMVIVFADGDVEGGADVATLLVDAGMGSLFTRDTYDAMKAWVEGLEYDPYTTLFEEHDNVPPGGERKIVPLPDGTPVPYVHTGYGDGGYPVFTLTDAEGAVVAAYADFMGCDEAGKWLAPPGVAQE
ncbi:MAG: DUF4241 domain-containing protein [Pseudomonadota bacterium]